MDNKIALELEAITERLIKSKDAADLATASIIYGILGADSSGIHSLINLASIVTEQSKKDIVNIISRSPSKN